jgi:hypothetical protein
MCLGSMLTQTAMRGARAIETEQPPDQRPVRGEGSGILQGANPGLRPREPVRGCHPPSQLAAQCAISASTRFERTVYGSGGAGGLGMITLERAGSMVPPSML